MKRSPMPPRKQPMKRTAMKSVFRVRPGWWQVRKFVAGRADGRCEAAAPACTYRGEHAHHILTRGQRGDDSPGNLLWVCAACHRYIHANTGESYLRGWLRHRVAS